MRIPLRVEMKNKSTSRMLVEPYDDDIMREEVLKKRKTQAKPVLKPLHVKDGRWTPEKLKPSYQEKRYLSQSQR